MKNQGFWITRIVSAVLAAAVLAYMIFHISAALDEPLRTVAAVRITTPHTTPVEGVVIRSEKVFQLPSGLVAFSADEGEHVAKGQTLAVAYRSQTALDNIKRIDALEQKLAMLGHIAKQNAGITDISRLDASIRGTLADVLSAAEGGQPASLYSSVLDFRALLFRQEHTFESAEVLEPLRSSLEAQIAELSGSLEASSGVLTADDPGLFSSSTDGLETVWTEALANDLTVEDFRGLYALQPSQPAPNLGKLVYHWRWYYACLLPVAETGVEGQMRNLRFADGDIRQLKVHSVSEETGGLCVVVFSSNRYMADILTERKIDAEIVWNNYDGIRIPHNGMRIEDGQHFVYCLVLGRVVRKNVTPIAGPESDTYYLCAYDPGNKSALLPGDEIITSGKNLYVGKVI